MAVTDRQKIVDSVPQKGFFGHPKGLFTLFSQNFGSVSLIMACELSLSTTCIMK